MSLFAGGEQRCSSFKRLLSDSALVALLRGPAPTHLYGVYEQWVAHYLVLVWIQKLPRGDVVNMAFRAGGKNCLHTRVASQGTREWGRAAAQAAALVVGALLSSVETHVVRKIRDM